MTRLLAALLLPLPALAAPGVKDKPVYYYPTAEGDKRVYESQVGKTTLEITEVVTKVEPKGDGLRVTLGRVIDGTTRPQGPVDVSARGVFRTAGSKHDGEPFPLVKLPVKAGDTWSQTLELPTGRDSMKVTYTVVGEEDVEVPAGKFKAVRIDQVGVAAAGTIKGSSWHAPGIGLIKETSESPVINRSRALKSFTPGKK